MNDTEHVKLEDLLDFSRVGYREGHVAIPQAPVHVTLLPSSNNTDDTTRIQNAIDKVSAMDLAPIGNNGAKVRGAVLLKAGVYRVAGALILHSSGVVLRGEGKGTIMQATGESQRDFIMVNALLKSNMGSLEFQEKNKRYYGKPADIMVPKNEYKASSGPVTYTRESVDIPVGETHIPVKNTADFIAGDRIVIERPAIHEWIRSIGMDKLGAVESWNPDKYTFRFERTIVGIDSDSNEIEIDIPMVMNLDPKYPPAKIFEFQYKKDMISDVGVENMCLDTDYKKGDPDDESHAWYAVVLDNVCNGWVADVTTNHFVCGIFASTWSRYITIQDCSVLDPISKSTSEDGLRRYAFNLSGQMGLVKRCFTNRARHDFMTLARVCGPNAFVESEGVDATDDTGPHERWAMGTLFDNIICNEFKIQNRKLMGTGQGWAGVYHVVYNCTAKNEGIIRNAPGTKNWVIGFNGPLDERPDDGVIDEQKVLRRLKVY
ncbi:hypothetical protein CPC16_000067 [Podila verticillata]|nr:hypothetical protein CPC16_000067 [Podila verticillata]KAI9237516.1 MAG: hypothetical protein BYD32DRAFT_461525 [Podila humilis]